MQMFTAALALLLRRAGTGCDAQPSEGGGLKLVHSPEQWRCQPPELYRNSEWNRCCSWFFGSAVSSLQRPSGHWFSSDRGYKNEGKQV